MYFYLAHADLAYERNVPSLLEASINVSCEFGRDRGAMLIIPRPRISEIPRDVLLRRLLEVSELKDKCLVTQVIDSPAYSLYLSNESASKHHFL